MSTRKIVTNSFYFGVIPRLSTLVNVIILPIITPFLTTFDYGIQGVVTSYTGLMAMVTSLGLAFHLTNSYYEYPKKYNLLWGRILFLWLVSGLVFGILNIAILCFVLPFGFSFKSVALSTVGTMPVFLFANSQLAQSLFTLEAKPKPLVFTNLFASLLGIGVSFVMIRYFNMGYWGLLASYFVSSIVGFLLFIKYVWVDYEIKPIVERNRSRLNYLLKTGLPLIPHNVGFILLTSSARMVMSLLGINYDDIGLYSHGCTMGEYIQIITNAVLLAIVPQMQLAYRSKNNGTYRKLFYFSQGVAITLCFLFCIWMDEVYAILIRNEALRMSSSIATLMCFANVVLPLYTFMSTPMFIEKQTKHVLWLVFVPGIMNLVFCFVFIPIFGYKAAIYSTIVSYWSQMLIPFVVKYFNRSVKNWLGDLRKLLVLLVLTTATLLVANVIGHWSMLIRIVITIIIGIAFIWVYKKTKMSSIL